MIIDFHSFFLFGLQSTGSADAARDILIDGIKHVPHCKLLLKVLVFFHLIISLLPKINRPVGNND
jgi:hypothetical protein